MAGGRTVAVLGVFIIFLVVFAFALVTYTRRVDGVSMVPTLVQGDLVIIQNVPIGSVHLGDVIVYGAPCSAVSVDGVAAPVIHRVVKIENISGVGLGFITKGDDARTNPYTDQAAGIATSPITAACLEGKVVFVIPYIERIASLPDGLNYVIAVIIIIVVVVYEFWGGEAETEDETGGQAPAAETPVGSDPPTAPGSVSP